MTVSFLSRLFRALTLRARVRLVFATHPVSAVISLVQVFVARGAFLRTLGLDFFTFTYIVIYVGAIAVLFLFVIMLLDTRSETLFESKRVFLSENFVSRNSLELNKNSYFSSTISNHSSGRMSFVFRRRRRRFFLRLVSGFSISSELEYNAVEAWNLEEIDVLSVGPALGFHLYTTHILDFLLRAMLLLVAIVGSIQISFFGMTFQQKRKSQTIFQQMARQESKTIRFLFLLKLCLVTSNHLPMQSIAT